MKRAIRAVIAALAVSAALPHDRAANAQNALGTGNALDANQSAGGGPLNTPLPLQDYRARNLIITGNVAGGRGFKGSVGYHADGDFTATLGTDDLYGFRAGSAMSGIEYLNFGRNYDRLVLGQDLGVIEYRRSAFSPTGRTLEEFTGQKPIRIVTHSLSPLGINHTGPAVDAEVRLDRAMSDISYSSLLSSDAEPQTVGTVRDANDNPLIAKSSSLRGLRFENPGLNVQQIGLNTYDLARTMEEVKSGAQVHVGRRFETSFESLPDTKMSTKIDTRVAAQTAAGPEQTGGTERYNDILRTIAERYAGGSDGQAEKNPELLKGLEKDYTALRRQLTIGTAVTAAPSTEFSPDDPLGLGVPGGEPAGAGSSETQTSTPNAGSHLPTPPTGFVPGSSGTGDQPPTGMPATGWPGSVPTLPTPPGSPTGKPGGLQPDSDTANPKGPAGNSPDLRQLGEALRHGQAVQHLAGDDAGRFNEVMSTAEDSMRKGEYFHAERRFSQALRYTPDHPLASVGVGHAQLGAGLYLSSALTLRGLLTHHPEMIDTRYDAGLLPTAARIDSAVVTLRKRMTEQRSRASDRSAAAFLLAYIGHQRQDAAMVRDGLDAMGELSPDESLTQLLRSVWLGGAIAPAGTGDASGKPAGNAPDK